MLYISARFGTFSKKNLATQVSSFASEQHSSELKNIFSMQIYFLHHVLQHFIRCVLHKCSYTRFPFTVVVHRYIVLRHWTLTLWCTYIIICLLPTYLPTYTNENHSFTNIGIGAKFCTQTCSSETGYKIAYPESAQW
jgi:hypothetical protein